MDDQIRIGFAPIPTPFRDDTYAPRLGEKATRADLERERAMTPMSFRGVVFRVEESDLDLPINYRCTITQVDDQFGLTGKIERALASAATMTSQSEEPFQPSDAALEEGELLEVSLVATADERLTPIEDRCDIASLLERAPLTQWEIDSLFNAWDRKLDGEIFFTFRNKMIRFVDLNEDIQAPRSDTIYFMRAIRADWLVTYPVGPDGHPQAKCLAHRAHD